MPNTVNLKPLAWKAYRRFRRLPGCYLDAEDFEMVGAMAIHGKDQDKRLLRTIAYRRMICYGRQRCHTRRRIQESDDLKDVPASAPGPLHGAINNQVRGWVRPGRFGLSTGEAQAIYMRFWWDANYTDILRNFGVYARFKKNPARMLVESGLAKIRAGLAIGGVRPWTQTS